MAERESTQLDISAQPEAVREARDAVRKLTDGWGPADVIDDLILCLSEALTNAITHAAHGRTLAVHVSQTETFIRIEVTDCDRHPPVFAIPAEVVLADNQLPERLLEEHGRGLFLIDALSSRWGIEPRSPGKVVWFEQDIARR
ncbi:ATP-binding protein [Sphaerisporangium sp. NPDC049002]|uniref:ATP-binding protein n=1 Tax=Sphaerisporangium sp. NPDC049002 TaxID=3155392 RepID=UPI0033F553AC